MEKSQKFYVYDRLLNWHIHWTHYFTVANFGNRLQNMFYRECQVFSTSVSYTTLRSFDLNFWFRLWSLTAECVELKKTIRYNDENSIYKMKIRWRLYAVTLIITSTNFPSWSWAGKQRVWSSIVWQTVILEWIKIFQKVCRGCFLSKGLSSYLACVMCHLLSPQNARCIALRRTICDHCSLLNVSWQTD